MNTKVYIHELIDIIGPNRPRYMHHMTANWVPSAIEERHQLCYGVWGTLGSTGRWPQVVNMWEFEGWESLASNFGHEVSGTTMQDPTLAEWWNIASSLRRGGVDRIMVPAPWTKSIDALIQDGTRGLVYAHELYTTLPGEGDRFLEAVRETGRPAVEALGLTLVGAFQVAMQSDDETLLLWAIPSWDAWTRYEMAWSPGGSLYVWRSALLRELKARWRRSLMIEAPLSPMRIGRQPRVSDRRPLSEL